MKTKPKKKEPKKPQNVCEICEKVFRRKDHYQKHKAFHEGKTPSYSCKFCGKIFSSTSNVPLTDEALTTKVCLRVDAVATVDVP